jgi:serine acetyltransferase
MKQVRYFYADVLRMLGKNKWRILILFLSRIFAGVFWYRVDRSLFLMMGKNYRFFRILLSPVFYLVQAYSNIDIHYESDIGPGLLILHSSGGIVISGNARIGKNLTLSGGNIIGLNKNSTSTEFRIGDGCYLGANACVIGPLVLGNKANVGACACVVKSFFDDNLTLVGVPAKVLMNEIDE